MKLGCNHPIGPLALADLVGLDTLLSVMEVFQRDLRRSEVPAGAAAARNGLGRLLGRKSGQGFLSLQLTVKRESNQCANIRRRWRTCSSCCASWSITTLMARLPGFEDASLESGRGGARGGGEICRRRALAAQSESAIVKGVRWQRYAGRDRGRLEGGLRRSSWPADGMRSPVRASSAARTCRACSRRWSRRCGTAPTWRSRLCPMLTRGAIEAHRAQAGRSS